MDKNEILFSIIVPVYNTGKYVQKCLESLVKAIDTDCEVIIVNDGSTDNSEEIIKDFIEKLPKEYKEKFIYTFKENKGLADTKNVGISMARGEFISVIDSDDYISDDFYTIARRYIKEGYEIIIYDLYIIYENHYSEENEPLINHVARAFNDEKDDFKTSILCGAMQGSSCNKIISKKLYEPYKFPTNKEYEDTAVTPFILMDTDKIKYIPYPLYYYLQRSKSIVASNTYITAFYKICENISNVLKEKNEYKKYNNVINEFFVERGLETLYQDYQNNPKPFWKKLEDFAEQNKDTIKYIIDNKVSYSEENHYSPRQKNLLNNIYQNMYNKNFKDVKKLFFTRRLVNYVRKVYRGLGDFIKTLLGRK